MRADRFKDFLASMAKLTPKQVEQLLTKLTSEQSERNSYQAIEQVRATACPHCGGGRIVRNGLQNGLQRMLCRGCSKTFNATTGTPLCRLKSKEKFEAYAQCLRKGMTVRKTADELGMSVDRAFRWRHRCNDPLKSCSGHNPERTMT